VAAAHILTADPELADKLGRLALIAAVPVSSGSSRRDVPAPARLVLAGPDMLPLSVQRAALLVVTRDKVSVELLTAALESGARGVAALPLDEARVLQELLTAEAPERPGRLVGVAAASGGLGASSFATACALALSPSLLVDCDPLGGGLDAQLGIESQAGPRWGSLAESRGRVSAATLREALPSVDGVAVLAHDGSDVPAAALSAVVGSGVADGGAVILDLPRNGAQLLREGGLRLDEALLLVADEVPGVLAAARVAAAFAAVASRVRLVLVRCGGGLDQELVSRSLELPVAARLTVESRPPGLAGRPGRSWVRAARELLG
jgi:secretion/DNA translocation related CpaE-like protein